MIKLKAWDKQLKRIVNIRELHFNANDEVDYVIIVEPIQINSRGDVGFDFPKRDIDEIELIRYTESKDKNQKEIYEGDIVEGFILLKGVCWDFKGTVTFSNSQFLVSEYRIPLSKFTGITNNNEIKVIGNKHENP